MLQRVGTPMYLVLMVIAAPLSILNTWATASQSVFLIEVIADSILVICVALYLTNKTLSIMRYFVVVALISEVWLIYGDPPTSLIDGLALVLLVVPAAIMGFYVSNNRQST